MKLGKINHIGIVVKDWEDAAERYSKQFGIKHWYENICDEGTFDVYYHGEKKNSNVRIFFGGKGTTKIELIEPRGDKLIYDYFYEKHGEAYHHVMYMTKNLDATVEEFKSYGWQVFQNANFLSNGSKVRYAYMGVSEDGPVVEFIECSLTKKIKKGDLPFEIFLGTLTGNYKKVK